MADHVLIDRAVVQQALEALERARPLKADYTTLEYFEEAKRKHYAAMAALRAALAQAEPVQEPFALPCPTPKACREHCCSGHCIPRATSPQQAEPVQYNNEPSGYESITPAYTRCVSPARYAKFHDNVKRWYRPYWVSKAEQQAEPVQRTPATGAESCVPSPSFQMNTQAEPVAHRVVAGALFDFMGWLTSRRERLVLSSTDDAAPAADAIKDFAEMRGLSLDDAKVQDWNTAPPQQAEPVQDFRLTECVFVGDPPAPHEDWHHAISAMLREKRIKGLRISAATADDWNGTKQQRKPLTEEEIINIGKEARAIEGSHFLPVTFARAIERAHGIKEAK